VFADSVLFFMLYIRQPLLIPENHVGNLILYICLFSLFAGNCISFFRGKTYCQKFGLGLSDEKQDLFQFGVTAPSTKSIFSVVSIFDLFSKTKQISVSWFAFVMIFISLLFGFASQNLACMSQIFCQLAIHIDIKKIFIAILNNNFLIFFVFIFYFFILKSIFFISK